MPAYCIHPHCPPACWGCSGALSNDEALALWLAARRGSVQPKSGPHRPEAVTLLQRLERMGYLAAPIDGAHAITPRGREVASHLATIDPDQFRRSILTTPAGTAGTTLEQP